ncbi:MAG: flagellar motor switch protein FliG [Deltaproteobacteria bacterium]|nr:flagellar motor switch protein FliG [Deltaproteobacteria bacterium]
MDLIKGLTGPRKAAVLLMVMGESFTTHVFKHLDEHEVKVIGEHMAQIKSVDTQLIASIMDEFFAACRESSVLGVSGSSFFKKTVSQAFDSRKADSLLSEFTTQDGHRPFEMLRSLSPQVLANLLRDEHPQTVALILVNLSHQTAAEVIQLLPEAVQSEVVVRIAELDNVPDEIVDEIQEVIVEQIADIGNESNEKLGGIQAAAEIMNQVDQKTETSILERIEADREELAEEIRQSMFVFEDLIHLDDRSIRTLLKEISNDELILALKTASEGLADKIFGNVSQRAAQMMKEDMEVMGPVRLRDVEQAQQNILKTARRLEEEGKIVLGGKGGDDVLV